MHEQVVNLDQSGSIYIPIRPPRGCIQRLLSLSLPTYRLKWTVQASSAGVFQTGNAILGRVTVTAGTSTFDVPFIVGIP